MYNSTNAMAWLENNLESNGFGCVYRGTVTNHYGAPQHIFSRECADMPSGRPKYYITQMLDGDWKLIS